MNIDIRSNAVAGVAEQILLGITFLIFYGYLIRQFGAAEVGILSLLLLMTTVGSLGNVGFGSAISHFIPLFEAREDRRSTALYLETAVVCTFGIYFLILAAALVPFSQLIVGQVGPSHASLVLPLMVPTTVYVLLLGGASATSAALTALHRNDQRLWSSMAGAASSLAITIFGAPQFGIVAGAWGLAAHAGVTMIANWALLTRILPDLSPVPWRFTASAARALLSLGSKMQAQTLLVAGVEPVSRLLLSHFGSLDAVAYFSMAGRFVLQMRTLIFAAAQPLIGAFSKTRETGRSGQQALYRNATLVACFSTLIIMSGTAASSPFVGEIWTGTQQNEFVLYVYIISIGWALNAMTLVAYFNTVSIGIMKWNLVGHVVFFVVNLVLGLVLGTLAGADGVVVAMSIALSVSALVFEVGNARYAPDVDQGTIRIHAPLAISCIVAATVTLFSYEWLRTDLAISSFPAGVLIGLIWIIIIAPAAMVHPARQIFYEALKR